MPISRRQFLTAAGAAGALAASGAAGKLVNAIATGPSPTGQTPLPAPADSGIEHIVVVCMENRSFDHYLGWVKGAAGQQAGLTYFDSAGLPHTTHRLDTWQGCGFNDPGHGYSQGRVQWDKGALDGFVKNGSGNDDFALGYYERDQLPFHAAVVDNFTICDHYFCSILGPTFPNRFYTHAAQTDRITNSTTQSTLPTIWDNVLAGRMTGNYYFSDEPFLALWADKYVSLGRDIGQFSNDAAAGLLPQYSYLDPFFVGEDQGGSNDDHPHADIRRGQAFLGKVVNAVMTSPLWSKTVLVITYDEWGGFFDTVAPVTLPDAFTPTATEEHNTSGFRVPCYVISPFARKAAVDHTTYDHSSILKMVEWRFGLAALTPRDAAANNLANALDFSQVNTTNPAAVPQIPDPGPHYCNGTSSIGVSATGMNNADPFWEELSRSALVSGWRNVG